MSPVHHVWLKPSCKAQWKGEEDMADRGRWWTKQYATVIQWHLIKHSVTYWSERLDACESVEWWKPLQCYAEGCYMEVDLCEKCVIPPPPFPPNACCLDCQVNWPRIRSKLAMRLWRTLRHSSTGRTLAASWPKPAATSTPGFLMTLGESHLFNKSVQSPGHVHWCLLSVEISSSARIPLLKPGSVHRGWVSWDDWPSAPWWVAREFVSLIGFHTMLGLHTMLGQLAGYSIIGSKVYVCFGVTCHLFGRMTRTCYMPQW